MNTKPLLTIILVVISFTDLFGQVPLNFSSNPAFEQKTIDAITKQYQKDIQNIQGPDKKYIADIYKERFIYIKEKFSKKEILSDDETQSYLDKLTDEILQKNSFFKAEEVRILFSRSYIPNASSMGEGTIFFHIGLFHRLQNESQAAFVICHELAHYYLDHTNNGIQKYVATVYSDEFQKELKKIQKTAYGRNNQLEKMAKNMMFKNSRHTREFEQSADSMAIELLKNTNFDVREALSCLALLDSVDRDKYHSGIQLEKQFNFSSYPFKKSWLNDDDLKFAVSKDEEAKKEEDSLKTHPECSVRIERLKERVNSFYKTNSKQFVVDEKKFNHLKNAFDYEIIRYAFESKNLSKGIFLALEMQGAHPDDIIVRTAIGKGLNEVYKHQKDHTLGKIIDLPSPEYERSYNDFLRLLQNLRLTEVAALSYYFLTQYKTKNDLNEEYVQALIESADHFEKFGEKQDWIDYYKKNFH